MPRVMPQRLHNRLSMTTAINLNSYIAVVGVHTSLWTFTALYLPRTSLTNGNTEWDSSQQLSSRDRPQHPFMVALTQNPTWTLACICLGAGLVQTWWARQVRRWWLDLVLQGTQEEKRIQSVFHNSKNLTVRTITHQNYPNFKINIKIDVSSSMGSNFFGFFCDTSYLSLIRCSYLKVPTIFKKPQNLCSFHLLQSHLKDISIGTIDIDCHSLYPISGLGYSYA